MLNNKIIINKLLDLAKKAKKCNEIPVSAIILKDNKIISFAYNKREKRKDITAHAEVLAIRKAAKKLKTWNLSDCELYVSLKPCQMCNEIIKQSRIKRVYYLLDKPSFKKEYNQTEYIYINNNQHSTTYQQLLSDFFQNIR